MGGSCGTECKLAKQKVEHTNQRIDELRSAMQAAAEKSREMQEKLELKYREMLDSKNMHIQTLKDELESAKQAKREVDNDVRRLQQNIHELQKEHSAAMLEANRIFAQTIEKKDEMMKEMMKDMFAQFKDLIKDTNAKNERQFDKMMAQMERQDNRIADILDRMDKRLAKLEERQFGGGSLIVSTTASADGLDSNYSGAQLYKMVEERKQELANRDVISQIHFQPTTPIITAAFAALDTVARYSGIPVITSAF